MPDLSREEIVLEAGPSVPVHTLFLRSDVGTAAGIPAAVLAKL
jgi:hypothetical protein